MSRPVVTASMLEDLRRGGKEIRLVQGSLLTPAARDWLKELDTPVNWVEAEQRGGGGRLAAVMDPALPELRAMRAMLEQAFGLAAVLEPAGGRAGIPEATAKLCAALLRTEANKGVIFTQEASVPVCLANKQKGIRAALGMNVPMVEQACRELAINVLVIEYPALTVYQIRQMLDRLLQAPAAPPERMSVAIEDIERGGGRADR